jgi:hypothetical protein
MFAYLHPCCIGKCLCSRGFRGGRPTNLTNELTEVRRSNLRCDVMATRMRLGAIAQLYHLVTCSCLPVIYCICFLYNYSRGLFRGGRPTNLEESQGIAAATSPSMGLSVRFKSVAGPKFIGFRAIALVLGIHTRRALRRPASCSTTRRAAQVASQATPKVASRAASVSCGALPHRCLGKPEGFSFKVTESQFVF